MSGELAQAADQAKCSVWVWETGQGPLDVRGQSLKPWAHSPSRPSPNLAAQAKLLCALRGRNLNLCDSAGS